MEFDDLVKEIGKMVEPLKEQFSALIPGMEQEVDYIIQNNIQDINRIEHLADNIVNTHNMVDVKYLFDRLMDYYSGFANDKAESHRKFFRHLFEDEMKENQVTEGLSTSEIALQIIKNGKNRLYTEMNVLITKTFWELGRFLNILLDGVKENSPTFKNTIASKSQDLRKNIKTDLLYTEEHLRETYYLYKLFPDFDDVPRLLSWTHYHVVFSKSDKKDWLKYISLAETEGLSYEKLKLIITENQGKSPKVAINKKKPGKNIKPEIPFKN